MATDTTVLPWDRGLEVRIAEQPDAMSNGAHHDHAGQRRPVAVIGFWSYGHFRLGKHPLNVALDPGAYQQIILGLLVDNDREVGIIEEDPHLSVSFLFGLPSSVCREPPMHRARYSTGLSASGCSLIRFE